MDDAVLALGQWTLSFVKKRRLKPSSSPVEMKGWQMFEDTLING
ncbi:hypothetical protein N9X96_00810 [bacterium]|jgi:hypothetical protein|nr:hypothetical protein [Candidatus Poseidoniales archaeon]MDB2457546.1 hypothetical protein [bacterium]MDB2618574.1 hypothetical protein [bacterium]